MKSHGNFLGRDSYIWLIKLMAKRVKKFLGEMKFHFIRFF